MMLSRASMMMTSLETLKKSFALYIKLFGESVSMDIGTEGRSEIKERVRLYNIELEERAKFGQQVQSMNEAWSRFNNSLDELQRALSKVN